MSGIRVITESCVLLLVVALANAMFGNSDPGWLALNPTPYLLVPILIGMRYGTIPGLFSGIFAAAIMTCAGSFLGGGEVSRVVDDSAFTLLALPALGLLTGELHRAIFSRSRSLARRASELEGDVARLGADLALARESQGQLQEQLALHGAEFCSADSELHKLFDDDAGPLLPGTLDALSDLCDVGAAAFYLLGANKKLELEAAHGDPGRFPAVLEGDTAKIAMSALDEGKLVTCRSLWDGGKAARDIIAALPLSIGGDRWVLVIADMPFAAIHWQNFARIEVFCRWVAETEAAKADDAPVLAESELHERVELAARTVAEQGLPTTVVLFTAAAGLAGSPDQASLQAAVLPQLRAADVAGTVGRDGAHLAVLLPMGGAREAGRLVEAVGDGWSGESYVIRSADGAEEIWKALTDVR